MATKLYDIAASHERVARVQKAVARQKAYIEELGPIERISAQKNLEILEEMLFISQKTHELIAEVLLARGEVERSADLHPLPV